MKTKKNFCIAVCLLLGFVLWTILVCTVDVQAIGPEGTTVGFATANGFIHNLTGVHMQLYIVTDWLGLIPFLFIAGFAGLGLYQWIKRKQLVRVDYSIRALGVFYLVVMAAYALFELWVVNYRPVLINGSLEASYPSSTTMLVMCVMPTAIMQLNMRLQNKIVKKCVSSAIMLFTAFMVVSRFVSGVHWASDIIGGVLLSAGLAVIYQAHIQG